MNYYYRFIILIVVVLFNAINISAQDKNLVCKVELKTINDTYTGECKNGFAHGEGEAKGIDRYAGSFKYGLPHGKGIYYYNNDIFYSGNFQEGLKEGKGEMHYKKEGIPDSVVKGFWSGDKYRGKKYKTYNITEMPAFDRFDITPSDESGKTLTIEIASATGNIYNQYRGSGNVLTVINIITKDGSMIRKIETPLNTINYTTIYELSEFPVSLLGTFSNGQPFHIELYKKAKWRIQIYMNK